MLYHVTEKKNLPSIMEQGLLPFIGERSEELGEAVPAIYLFPDRQNCDTALGSWLGECFEDLPEDALVILEIHPEGLFLAKDENVPFECISYDPISSAAIPRVLGEDFLPLGS